jgi:hypothetical protein
MSLYLRLPSAISVSLSLPISLLISISLAISISFSLCIADYKNHSKRDSATNNSPYIATVKVIT